MKKFKFLLPVSLLLLVACNSQQTEKEDDHENHQQSEMKEEQKVDKENHEASENKVLLDNGKKWKANAETITGISTMTALVQNGIAGKLEGAKLL